MMVSAAQTYKVDAVFAGLIVFMVLSLIMTAMVRGVERNLSRWRPEQVKSF